MLHRKECIASNICVWLLCMYRAPRTLYCMYRGGEAECRTGNGQNSPHSPLLSRIDKSSLGVPRIGVATPWDDCPYAKSNANTFVRARAYRVFLTSCVGINLGDIPPHSVGKPYTHSPPSSIVTIRVFDWTTEPLSGLDCIVDVSNRNIQQNKSELRSAVPLPGQKIQDSQKRVKIYPEIARYSFYK